MLPPRMMEGATNPPWVCGIPKILQNEGKCLKLSFVRVRSAVSPYAPSLLVPLIPPGPGQARGERDMPAPRRRPLVSPLSLPPHGKAGVQSWHSLASVMSPLPFPAWLDGILGLLLVTIFLQD